MDFFEQQDKARGKTGTLIFYFVLGVFCIMLAVFALFSFVFGYNKELSLLAWTGELALMTGIGTIVVVCLDSLGRIGSLSSRGATVAIR